MLTHCVIGCISLLLYDIGVSLAPLSTAIKSDTRSTAVSISLLPLKSINASIESHHMLYPGGSCGGIGTEVASLLLFTELLDITVKLLDSSQLSVLATRHLLLASLFSLSSLSLSRTSDFALETKSITSTGSSHCCWFRDARSRACISSTISGIVSYHFFPTGGLRTHSLPGSHK
jgi:hypothetical protein